MVGQFWILLKKEWRLESRSLETLALMVCLAVLLAVTTAIGLENAFIEQGIINKIFPTLVWLIFIFTATMSLSRSFEAEYRQGAMHGVLLTGVSGQLIYLAKFVAIYLSALVGLCLVHLALVFLLGIELRGRFLDLLLIYGLMVAGYAALTTLLAAAVTQAKLRAMLLPMILIPLLFPLLFCGIELMTAIVYGDVIGFDSFWLRLLIVIDFLYLILGITLFEFILKG